MIKIVSGFLYHKMKLLIVQRSANKSFSPNVYELPGGKVDPGENMHEAVKREFMEEVNIPVSVLDTCFFYESDHKGERIEKTSYFVCADDVSSLRLSEEHQSYVWITEEELENYNIAPKEKANMIAGFKAMNNCDDSKNV